MKFVLRDLQIGESLQGRVAEVLSESDVIISFDGDLLRVHNETRRPLRVGDTVTCIVRAIQPLRFQLIQEREEQKRRGRIDVSV